MKGEVREREREGEWKGVGAQTSAKSGRSPRGSSTTLAYRFVSCRTSKWVTVGLMLLLMVANGSMWVFVGVSRSL